jgi:hypothetical protein
MMVKFTVFLRTFASGTAKSTMLFQTGVACSNLTDLDEPVFWSEFFEFDAIPHGVSIFLTIPAFFRYLFWSLDCPTATPNLSWIHRIHRCRLLYRVFNQINLAGHV